MTEAEALARLTVMTAAESDPVLDSDELEMLLADHRVADATGLGPADAAYTDTWDLRAAAAEGWRWKAAKVASRYTFSSDVHSHQRDQLQKHCLAMVKEYSASSAGSIELAPRRLYDPVIGNLNGGN